MKLSLFAKYLVLAGYVLFPVDLKAEGGTCPLGYYLHNMPGVMGCAPIPGYGGGGSPLDPGPQWETRWGAIATSCSGYAAASDQSSKRKARKEALRKCKAAGYSRCKISLEYYNQCGALAWGESYMATCGASELEQAEALAIKSCEERSANCKVIIMHATILLV